MKILVLLGLCLVLTAVLTALSRDVAERGQQVSLEKTDNAAQALTVLRAAASRTEIVERSADDRRETVDAAFVARRRAGFITWDGLTVLDKIALLNVVMLHRLANNVAEGQLEPNLFALHPVDRPLLDRFSTLLQAERRSMEKYESQFAPIIAAAQRGEAPANYELLTMRVEADDPRLANSTELFVVRWEMDRAEPGYYEAGPVAVDETTGETLISMHWVKPNADPQLGECSRLVIESRRQRSLLAETLFPRLYHEVK